MTESTETMKRLEVVVNQIYAITTKCLLEGHLPTQKTQLMKLFSNVNATKEEIVQLAKENKLKWVYDISLIQSKEEFNRNMNTSLAHYLSN